MSKILKGMLSGLFLFSIAAFATNSFAGGVNVVQPAAGGTLAVGGAVTYGYSDGHGKVTGSTYGKLSGSKKMDGLGGNLLMSYYFANYPTWFIFGSVGYPGDHCGKFFSGQTSNSNYAKMSIVKHWTATVALAHVLATFGQGGQFSFGLGMTAINQTIHGLLDSDPISNGSPCYTETQNVFGPSALLQVLYPIAHNIVVVGNLVGTRIPDQYMNEVGSGSNADFRARARFELQAMLGVMYQFKGLE